MADKTIPGLTAGAALTGAELLHMSQGGNSRKTSVAALALAGALRADYGGTANAITLTTGAGLAAVPVGLELRFRATAANTGGTTINVDGTGAVAANTIRGTALPAGYIRTDVDTVARYDGSVWTLDRQVERGSNISGEYVRFADGTQTTTRTTEHDGLSIDVASGSLYRHDGNITHSTTMPAAFTAVDAAGVEFLGSDNAVIRNGLCECRFGYFQAGTTYTPWSGLQIFCTAAASGAAGEKTVTKAWAIGRWY